MQIKVDSQARAFDLAVQLQQEHRYNWFRGQTKNWPLKPSFGRLDEENRERALERAERFFLWAQTTLGLEPMAAHNDHLIAVAQHYGLPTSFIDFTTDPRVAAFFSTYSATADQTECCIKCLNTLNLAAFAESQKDRRRKLPECLQFSVPNLWRMEAQSGVFLFCPYDDFESVYDGLLTILFPSTEAVKIPSLEEIFPTRKSALEILLDQYFAREAMITQSEALAKLIPIGQAVFLPMASPAYRGDASDDANVECPYFSPHIFLGGQPPPRLHSWNSQVLARWLAIKEEPYRRQSESVVVDFPIDWLQDPNTLKEESRALVASHLAGVQGTRSKMIEFRFHSVGRIPPLAPASGLLKMVQHYWDGVRQMPYTDEAIAEGIGNCIALQLWLNRFGNESNDQLEVAFKTADSCFGRASYWRLISSNGAETLAFASSRALARCVRPDIGKFLKSEYKWADPYEPGWEESSLSVLIQALAAPSHLLEYPLLSDLFARQLLPYQVVFSSPCLNRPISRVR